ncbi:MAG: hypothetical protein AAF485_05585, partial [Chloroflexota bacterium]
MLWLPSKKTRKALKRLKRRRRRRNVARVLLFLFILCGLGNATVPPIGDLYVQIDQTTKHHQFDFIDWESQAVVSEIKRQLITPDPPLDTATTQAKVEQFLDIEHQIRTLRRDLNILYSQSTRSANEVSALEVQLSYLKSERQALAPEVEHILTQQIEAILRDEGLLVANTVFPPVAFRLLDPPTALIISPRDQIKNEHFTGLEPGLDNAIRADIENDLNQRGDISSYITNIGGLGSYPSMVINHDWLPILIDIIAHEWTHNYLYTFPTNIAWGYQIYPQLTTINETAASLVGEEISRKVILRFYPDWVEYLPPIDETGQKAPGEPSEFHLAMRDIRVEVDHLLAAGQIEEAEAYMEAERLKLVKKGYNLRVLNQAYFAFHGSYALSPTSTNPIGPQIRQLRAQSPSLKA